MIRCAQKLASAAEKIFTEHCGWKVQIALCIDRQPTKFVESQVDTAYREFFEKWCQTTKNEFKIPKLSTIERNITHKILPSKESAVKKVAKEAEDKIEPTGELDALLAAEITLKPTRRRTKHVQVETKQVSHANVDADTKNIERCTKDWLFLAVDHKEEGWKIPTTELYHGEGLREAGTPSIALNKGTGTAKDMLRATWRDV